MGVYGFVGAMTDGGTCVIGVRSPASQDERGVDPQKRRSAIRKCSTRGHLVSVRRGGGYVAHCLHRRRVSLAEHSFPRRPPSPLRIRSWDGSAAGLCWKTNVDEVRDDLEVSGVVGE